MDSGEIDQQLDQLEAACGFGRTAMLRVDTGHCDIQQLGRFRSLLNGLQNSIDGASTDAARRAGELRGGGGSRGVDDAMNPGGREAPGKERADKDRAPVFDAIPNLEDATKSGELAGVYTDIIAKAIKQLAPELRAEFYRRHQNLAELAAGMSEHQFRRHVKGLVEQLLFDAGVERIARQRRNRKASLWEDLEDGMIKLRCDWDPDTGARATAAIEAEVNAIFHGKRDDPADNRNREQVLADAVANLLCGTTVSQRPTGGTTLLVLTDHETLGGGPHEASVHEYGNGTTTPPSTLRSLVDDPDTEIRTVTVNQHGVVVAIGDAVLDEGRNQRFATSVQRLALRAMYRTCMIPGCTIPHTACEIHHLFEWDQGGTTDLVNLGPLCTYHHHLVHREGWRLELDPETRRLTITDPSGHTETHHFHGLAPPGHHHVSCEPADRDDADPPTDRRRAA